MGLELEPFADDGDVSIFVRYFGWDVKQLNKHTIYIIVNITEGV
jgi:hypothetical protein